MIFRPAGCCPVRSGRAGAWESKVTLAHVASRTHPRTTLTKHLRSLVVARRPSVSVHVQWAAALATRKGSSDTPTVFASAGHRSPHFFLVKWNRQDWR
jgi:hypothetical protein